VAAPLVMAPHSHALSAVVSETRLVRPRMRGAASAMRCRLRGMAVTGARAIKIDLGPRTIRIRANA